MPAHTSLTLRVSSSGNWNLIQRESEIDADVFQFKNRFKTLKKMVEKGAAKQVRVSLCFCLLLGCVPVLFSLGLGGTMCFALCCVGVPFHSFGGAHQKGNE